MISFHCYAGRKSRAKMDFERQ